jgi:signal transduction histidine kinase
LPNSARARGPGILVVVDETPHSGRLVEILGDTGGITVANSGEQALHLAAAQPGPDLILLDWELSGLSGLEVCRELKASPQTANIPIIVLTGSNDAGDEVRVLAAGAVDYLHKPLNPLAVQARIRMHLALAQQRQVLKQRSEQLEAVNQELESFCYSVSHDLRAPLRAIRGFSQALMEDCSDKLDEQGQDYLRRVLTASQRMDELIVDMLALSRVSRSAFTRESVDLSNLVRTTAEYVGQRHPHCNVDISVQDDIRVQGDARLLRIVAENLLENACKFTRHSAHPRIEFGSRVEEGKAIYYIKDNGIGFDERYADQLFTPFRRLHGNDDYPGTGVGLAIVQRAINRHGGRIWGKSEPGKGAEFCFTLQDSPEL